MASTERKPTAPLHSQGGSHAERNPDRPGRAGDQQGTAGRAESVNARSKRAADRADGQCHTADLDADGQTQPPRHERVEGSPSIAGGRTVANGEREQLILAVESAAIALLNRANRSKGATKTFAPGEIDDDNIDLRIASGDRLAIYDAVVSAITDLQQCREELGTVLVEDADTMARLAELRACKRTAACTAVICSNRWGQKKDAAATDCSGKKRKRTAGKPSSP